MEIKLKKGLQLNVSRIVNGREDGGCMDGSYRTYEVVDEHGNVLQAGTTCRCERGCANRDCIRDDWGYHDTDIEAFRYD